MALRLINRFHVHTRQWKGRASHWLSLAKDLEGFEQQTMLTFISEIVAHNKWQHFWFRLVPINWSQGEKSHPMSNVSASQHLPINRDRSACGANLFFINFCVLFPETLSKPVLYVIDYWQDDESIMGFLVMFQIIIPSPIVLWLIAWRLSLSLYLQHHSKDDSFEVLLSEWMEREFCAKALLCVRLQLHVWGRQRTVSGPLFVYLNPIWKCCCIGLMEKRVKWNMHWGTATRCDPLRALVAQNLTCSQFNNFPFVVDLIKVLEEFLLDGQCGDRDETGLRVLA